MTSRFGLEVRAATAADAPGLCELLETLGRPVAVRSMTERLDALSEEPGVVLIALEWGPPSGVVAVSWRRLLLADAPQAEVSVLAIDPQHRRRGVGRLLLKASSQAARLAGCAQMILDAPADAPGLQAFCRSSGFEATGARFTRPLRKKR